MKSITENLRLGVMDLFAVLMPGAVLCILLGQWPAIKTVFIQMLPDATSEWQGGLAFFICAYFMGYAAYSLSGRLADWIDYKIVKPQDWDLGKRVTPLKIQAIGFDDLEHLTNYQWALARLMMDQPELHAEVERYEATAKFFRSMVLVSLIAIITFWWSAGQKQFALGALCIFLISVFLYYDRHMKSLLIAYKRVLTMLGAPSEYPKDVVKDLAALNIRIGIAEEKKNYKFLNAIMADNLVFRCANTQVVINKSQYLNGLSEVEYHSIDSNVISMTIGQNGDVAYVVMVVVKAETQRKDQEAKKGIYRNERLFHKDKEGNWKMVGWVNEEVNL